MVVWCAAVVSLVACERLVELYLSSINAAWSRARGGIEFGQAHLGAMKLLHTALLVGCFVETYATNPAYKTIWTPLCAALAATAQILRYWCIATLGRRWNIRVIVLPGAAPIGRGPYAFLAHPNYLAVVLEGFALPMIFGAWRTALGFAVLNTLLLRRRIACESQAIANICGPYPASKRQQERAAC